MARAHARPAAVREPNVACRQQGHDDADHDVDGHRVAVLETQEPGRYAEREPGDQVELFLPDHERRERRNRQQVMQIPTVAAVCHCAPAEGPNSQGEKNTIMPRNRFATSQSFGLDQSSMIPSVELAHLGVQQTAERTSGSTPPPFCTRRA